MSRPTIRLILPRHHVHLVIAGKQTAHARLVAHCESEAPVRPGALVPVQKKGAGRVCSVRVSAVERRNLTDVDLLAARAMGHRTTAAWRLHLMRGHDRRIGAMSPEEFDAFTADPLAVELAWRDRWRDRDVWLIRFAYEPDLDERYIARGVGHETQAGEQSNDARGYTTNPAMGLQGEPPAVDDATLFRYAEDAKHRHALHVAADRTEAHAGAPEDELAMKLAALRVLAKRRGLNIEGDVKALTDRINKLARKVREAA